MKAISGYNTRQKDVILDCLCKNSDKTFCAKELHALLQAQGTPVGLATVYRRLEHLVEHKNAVKIGTEGGGVRFQYLDGEEGGENFHLKCQKCGKITPAQCEWLEEMAAHMSENHGFELDVGTALLYGRCQNCK